MFIDWTVCISMLRQAEQSWHEITSIESRNNHIKEIEDYRAIIN